MLSAEGEELIRKNVKKYSVKYEAEDREASMYLKEEDHQRRKMLIEEWNRWTSEWMRLHKEDEVYRQMLRDGDGSEEEEEFEVEFEEGLDAVEEVEFDLVYRWLELLIFLSFLKF